MLRVVEWKGKSVVMIDQRLLPQKEVYRRYTTWRGVADAIRNMVVRGAPAIGVAAAMGLALGALNIRTNDPKRFKREFEKISKAMASTRPTAVNLFWAIERMNKVVDSCTGCDVPDIRKKLVEEAELIHREDIEINRRIGRNGSKLLRNNSTVLTHCNAGALATAGYGTALGVVRAAVERGKKIRVMADETRPFLQGARLTAWELKKDRIDVTVITDNMAGYMMKKGLIDAVIVGADRIASNGDVANKIGTYPLAILAKAHNIPFYVAAPLSTIDVNIKTGDEIPIEERDPGEVTHLLNRRIAPSGVKAQNPAFDVTPARLISAIVTEKGVIRPPYRAAVKRLFAKK